MAVALPPALTGCAAARDAFSPSAEVSAQAAGRELSTDRLVTLLIAMPGSIESDAAEFVANLWVDLTLFAEAHVNGTLGDDSVRVRRAVWPQLAQTMLGVWRDSLAAQRSGPAEAAVDSIYDAGDARLFQHILVQPAGTTQGDTGRARSRADRIVSQIRGGADFAGFTTGNPDATKEDKGFLSVGPRGQFVPEFETAAWALEPGQVSGVVKTQFGFHIIRRAPRDEARERFAAYVAQTSGARDDSVYVANLTSGTRLAVQKGAATVAKSAMDDREAARGSSKQLVRSTKGPFTLGDLVLWLEAFPPNAPAQIKAQPDSVIERFLLGLAQNRLVIRQVDSAGYPIPIADWDAAKLGYRAVRDQLAAAVGLADSAVTDTARPKAERLDSAHARVDRYLDGVIARRVQFRPIPGPLSGMLRETASRLRVNRTGLTRTMELVTAGKRADSAAAATSGQAPAGGEPPAIQPAPGPAPVPGGQPKQP
jgi:hypothetical protein